MDFKQGIALILIGLLIINLIFLGTGKISELFFWMVVGIIAIATVFYKKRYKPS